VCTNGHFVQNYRENNSSMPRYVILEHDHPSLHWDLLLERDGILSSWRLRVAPSMGEPFAAEESPPHRLLYLNYEGPVSGDRGRVTRWDGGNCVWLESQSTGHRLRLHGEKLSGELRLEQSVEGWRGLVVPTAG
jgi:hypothetical protein